MARSSVRLLVSSLLIQAIIFLDPTSAGKCGRSPVDIIFVLDESGSIWGPDFQKQLAFVQNLVDGFDVGPDGTHVGVETFGNEVRTIVKLNEFNDPDQLKKRIEAINQERGNTGTHLALMNLREMFGPKYSRPEASRVAIVITDGESDHPKETASEAELVHAEGIVVFAIGVGRDVKKLELERIASQMDYVFTVDSYEDLNLLLSILAIKACPEEETTPTTTAESWPEPQPATREHHTATPLMKTTTTDFLIGPVVPIPKTIEGCYDTMTFNIYFGLPDQMSIIDTYLVLQYIRDLTTIFSHTSSTIRPTLCPRICPVVPCWAAESFCQFPWNNKIDFMLALDERRAQSVTRHDLQLGFIRKQEEAYRRWSGEDQENLASLVVLFIDNRMPDLERMMREVAYAKKDGIRIVTIGIGDYIDRDELWKIASTEKDILYIRSYYQLPTIINILTERVCMRGIVHSAANFFEK